MKETKGASGDIEIVRSVQDVPAAKLPIFVGTGTLSIHSVNPKIRMPELIVDILEPRKPVKAKWLVESGMEYNDTKVAMGYIYDVGIFKRVSGLMTLFQCIMICEMEGAKRKRGCNLIARRV